MVKGIFSFLFLKNSQATVSRSHFGLPVVVKYDRSMVTSAMYWRVSSWRRPASTGASFSLRWFMASGNAVAGTPDSTICDLRKENMAGAYL